MVVFYAVDLSKNSVPTAGARPDVVGQRMDKYALKPVAMGWKTVVPQPAGIMIANAFDNITVVPRVINNLLQGKWDGAGREVTRFLINSTAGVGGLYDPARDVWHITKSPCALSLGDARLDRGSWARQRGRRPNAATTFGSVAKSCSVRASAASITSRATSLASASASRRLVPP